MKSFLLWVSALAFLLFPSLLALAEETHYVGDTIIVPITFTATLPVIALDFSVTVSGGELVNLQCGGSGFLVNQGSGNHCTLVHAPVGPTSGTAAVATVHASVAGTLTVSASGTLDAALGVPVSGSFSGGTFLIQEKPTPTPSSSSASSSTSSSSGSSGNSQTSNTSSTTNSSTTTDKTTTSTSSKTTGTPASSSSTNSRLIITAKEASQNVPIAVGDYQEVFFTVDALPAAKQPLILDFAEEAGAVVINFSSYMQAGQSTAQVVLPQTVILRKSFAGQTISVILPSGVAITAAAANAAVSGEWNGTMLAPTVATKRESNQQLVTLSLGVPGRTMAFSLPVEILLPTYSEWKSSFRQNEQQSFQDITTACTSGTRVTLLAQGMNACTQVEGKDLEVWTNHFSQFQFTKKVLSWETVGLIGLEALLLAFIILTLRPHKRSESSEPPAEPAPESPEPAHQEHDPGQQT